MTARPSRREIVVLLLVVAAFAASVAVQIAQQVPFENDESVYAVQARAWAQTGSGPGAPVTGVGLQRAPMLPAIGALLYKGGARTELPFRVVGFVFGVAAIVMIWIVGRALCGPAAGLLGAAVFASAPSVQQRSAQFLTDVPATALLLGLALILWRNRARAGPSLVLVAPAVAASIYMRYASILPAGLLILVALLLWGRALLRNVRLVVGTVVVTAALLVPHVVRAMDATGTPWGLILHTARFAGRAYLGQGLVQYLGWLPAVLAGPIAGIVIVLGIGGGVARAIRARDDATIFLLVPALADILLIGLTEHGDPRLVFFPVAMLCIAGARTVLDVVRSRRAIATVAAAGLVGGAVFGAVHNEHARRARVVPALAGAEIAARAQEPCVVLTVELSETTWYSGCSAYYFNAVTPAPPDFAVLFRTGGTRLRAQPLSAPPSAGPPISIRYQGREVATVYALSRPVQ